MATPKQLVECIAKVTGVAVNTVAVQDRLLAAAGLRTRALRGRANTQVTPTDAAHLLIATVASRSVKDSAATVRHFAEQAAALANDIRLATPPAARYEFALPSSGDAFYTVGFTAKTVLAVADLLGE